MMPGFRPKPAYHVDILGIIASWKEHIISDARRVPYFIAKQGTDHSLERQALGTGKGEFFAQR